MKKSLLLLILFKLSQFSFAQSNYSLVNEGTESKEVWCNYWASVINGVYFVDNLSIKGDTTFNGKTYKKLYNKIEVYKFAQLTVEGTKDSLVSENTVFYGGIRQDSQKVFIAAWQYDTAMNEKLIFDFSAEQGDTITTWLDLIGYQDLIVDSIIPISLEDGTQRKQYLLSEPVGRTRLGLYWIEGVGTNYGLVSSHYIFMNDESHRLRCFKQGGEKVFDKSPDYTDDCLAEPMQHCNVLSSGETLENIITISTFPNPMKDFTKINFSRNLKANVFVYDNLGRVVKCIRLENSNEITLFKDKMSAGVYFIKVESADKFIGSSKLIITN